MMDKGRRQSGGIHEINVTTPLPEEPFADRLAHWVQQHGPTVLYAGVGIVVLLLAMYAWSYRNAGDDEADYLKASVAYSEFSITGADVADPAASAAFVQLKEVLARHPDLSSRYDGLIAQTFLRLGDMKMALSYGQRALKQLTRENLPFYEDYSKTSLLIADGNDAEALKRAEFLTKKMNESLLANGRDEQARGFGDILFLSNLLRQAMLQEKMNNAEGELLAWQELQRAAETNTEAFARVAAVFKTGKIELNDYIEVRKKALRQ